MNFPLCRAFGLRILERPNIQNPTVLAAEVEALLEKLSLETAGALASSHQALAEPTRECIAGALDNT